MLGFIGLGGVAALALGYRFYGDFVAKVFGLDAARRTPAVQINDGNDFAPIPPLMLLGQHFAAIAAVGPIAGPILASSKFGWALSLAWIVLGAIFIGAVHDFSSLIASVRHGARSIAEVAGIYIGPLAHKIFLAYIWISLIYVITVFTDLTASAFISRPELGVENLGPGVGTTSFLYLGLALAMGFAMYKTKIPLAWITLLGVTSLLIFIKLGQYLPIFLPLKGWDAIVLAYCFVASVIPLWILLQPRGYLGGFLLYASLLAGLAGFVFYHGPAAANSAALNSQSSVLPLSAGFFPFLFTTIACGACSGFHGLVSSGTTSKQLRSEPDARIVGYGGMLLESFVALVALGTFVTMASLGQAGLSPDEIYARGLATFLTTIGLPFGLGVAFAKLAFATFIYDTLDVTTRLGRYIFQELTGMAGISGKIIATLVTLALPAIILLAAKPGAPPAWKSYWALFGTSNQLLACLTLATITVWLKKEGKKWWVTGLPCAFMGLVTLTSLLSISWMWITSGFSLSVVNLASLSVLMLAAAFLYMAGTAFIYPSPSPVATATRLPQREIT